MSRLQFCSKMVEIFGWRLLFLLYAVLNITRACIVLVDFNTYNTSSLLGATQSPVFRQVQGSWVIVDNSQDVSMEQWRAVLQDIGPAMSISEDNPTSFTDCHLIENIGI